MQRGADGPPPNDVHRASLLLREIINLTEQFEKQLGAELTVNRTDLEAMEQLIANGALSPTEISRRLGLTGAATTTVVDRLVAVGHVTRVPHPTDRRVTLVEPNPASVARAMGRLLPLIRAIDAVADRLPEAERDTVVRYLEAVAEEYRSRL